ncbi:MAG: metallophosphoesterase [Bryobacteraceae bacterium]
MTESPFLTILHISDLHFGATLRNTVSRFRKMTKRAPYAQGLFVHDFEIAQALSIRMRQILVDRKKRKSPVLVIHTGDLTSRGRGTEFAVGAKFLTSKQDFPDTGSSVGLQLVPQELVDIPGNHDLGFLANPRYLKFPSRLNFWRGLCSWWALTRIALLFGTE